MRGLPSSHLPYFGVAVHLQLKSANHLRGFSADHLRGFRHLLAQHTTNHATRTVDHGSWGEMVRGGRETANVKRQTPLLGSRGSRGTKRTKRRMPCIGSSHFCLSDKIKKEVTTELSTSISMFMSIPMSMPHAHTDARAYMCLRLYQCQVSMPMFTSTSMSVRLFPSWRFRCRLERQREHQPPYARETPTSKPPRHLTPVTRLRPCMT